MRRTQWFLALAAPLSLLAGVTAAQSPPDSATRSDSATAAPTTTPSHSASQSGPLREVGGELRFKIITVGAAHACGLTANGTAYCWGKNTNGQLGDSTTTDRPEPTPVSAGLKFKVISAGGSHTCGISKDNVPYCWGNNENGQLGLGTTTIGPSFPFRVAGDQFMTLIVAGPRHTCGTMKHWDKEGMALCWGYNADGQVGDMSKETASLPQAPFGVIRYVSLALGDRHTCGATREGRVFCWGDNTRGQLGNGSATESQVPFITRMNRRNDFTKVVAGAGHTCALSGTGDVLCWGENTAGQVGTGGKGGRVLSPAGVKEATGVAALYAAGNATCAQRLDGTWMCWGSNAGGLFGAPDLPSSRTPAPAFIGVSFSAFGLGLGGGCGVRTDQPAVCWGQGATTGSK